MRYIEVTVEGEGLDRYLLALAPTRANGTTRVVRLKAVDIDDEVSWFPVGTIAEANETFRSLFLSETARAALPDVLEDTSFPYRDPPVFHQASSGALMLEGELAGILSRGGAYVSFAGPDAEAKRLAAGAANDLLQDRYEDFRVFFSDAPWTPWFFDIAWDATWLLVDDANHEVTIIASTDTD